MVGIGRMLRRVVLAGAALAGVLPALDVPTAVLAIPADSTAQLPCGGAAVLMPGGTLAITLAEALPGAATTSTAGGPDPGQGLAQSGPGGLGPAALGPAAPAPLGLCLPGGGQCHAVVVRRGRTTTAVLLRLTDIGARTWHAQPLVAADSSQVRLGDSVWTVGNSFGSVEVDGVDAISRGTVSGLYDLPMQGPAVRGRAGRILSTYRGPVIEIDAAVNDGNQGGALVDDAGHLIGLVSLGTARDRRLGTAVPIDAILADLGLPAPSLAPVHDQDANREAILRHAQAAGDAMVLIYCERSGGLGNPTAMPRPALLPEDADPFDRPRIQEEWDRYYHQQQLFYTDQPINALVIDAHAGLMLTAASNLHGDVAQGAVLLPGQPSIPCHLVATNLPLDMALLRADQPLPGSAIAFVADPDLALGDAIGVAARLRGCAGCTLTSGIVSAIARHREQSSISFDQTDARANYGSLGGAVISPAGVVGMMVLLGPDDSVSPWEINSGVALFIDATTIRMALPGLERGDSVEHAPVLGLGIAAREASAPSGALSGVLVLHVLPHTGAADAGLHADDVITALDGQPVVSNLGLSRLLLRHRAGDAVQVRIQRGAAVLTLPVIIRDF